MHPYKRHEGWNRKVLAHIPPGQRNLKSGTVLLSHGPTAQIPPTVGRLVQAASVPFIVVKVTDVMTALPSGLVCEVLLARSVRAARPNKALEALNKLVVLDIAVAVLVKVVHQRLSLTHRDQPPDALHRRLEPSHVHGPQTRRA